MGNTFTPSPRAQRGNPDFGAAGLLRFARNDEILRVFASSRESDFQAWMRSAAEDLTHAKPRRREEREVA